MEGKVMIQWRYYSSICLESLKKTAKRTWSELSLSPRFEHIISRIQVERATILFGVFCFMSYSPEDGNRKQFPECNVIDSNDE